VADAERTRVLRYATGAEPSPAFSFALVFEQPILRLEHREELPSLGGRIFKFANEPLLVTFERDRLERGEMFDDEPA
jgi:hypothetical protein